MNSRTILVFIVGLSVLQPVNTTQEAPHDNSSNEVPQASHYDLQMYEPIIRDERIIRVMQLFATYGYRIRQYALPASLDDAKWEIFSHNFRQESLRGLRASTQDDNTKKAIDQKLADLKQLPGLNKVLD